MKNMKRTLIIFAFAAIVAGCNSNANENAKINQDSIRIANEKAKLDSFERADAAEKAAIVAVANERAARAQSSQNFSSRRTGTSRSTNYSSGSSNQTYAPAPVAQKKGWSSAAKGAVIGGVVGAGTGVLVDKKDGRGAVIGGVVGAGTGYVIGRSKDRKSGRVQ